MADSIKSVLRRNMVSAMDRGDLTQAALLLERLKEEDPLAIETRGMELDYLLRSRKTAESQNLAGQLLQLFPGSPRIHYLAGQVAYQAKNYGDAAERFRESIRLNWHWRSTLFLAKALTQLGEYDEAARIYESLLPEHSECYAGLAWLYERQSQFEQALACIESYLRERPENEWAKSQRLRLRARVLNPDELVREARGLLEFGEELAEPVVPQYLEALFRTGQAAEVRQFVRDRCTQGAGQLAVSAGWVCYRFQAYDLAFDLFLTALEANRGNVKFLSAIEFAAARCERLSELVRRYESCVKDDRRMYGRLHQLRRRARGDGT